MDEHREHDVTALLLAACDGSDDAAAAVLRLIYDQLRAMARGVARGEGPAATLEPTALVHEAWLRLVGPDVTHWESRAHFFGAAARAMRRILVERARKAGRARRGGGRRPLTLDEQLIGLDGKSEDLVALDEALDELIAHDRRKHDIVMLRFFAGLTVEEAARSLGVSAGTVKADWSFARAWLHDRMRRKVNE